MTDTTYTPTTDGVRDAWAYASTGHESTRTDQEARDLFDRWLAQYKQDVLRGLADKIREEAEYKEVYGCRAMHEAAEIVEGAGHD